MDSLNFIFGIRAINPPVEEEKQWATDLGNTPFANQKNALRLNEKLEEEDFIWVNERQPNEVIF